LRCATRGHLHGGVTDWSVRANCERIKPFVFLDYFDADPATAPKFGFHPHSECDPNPHSGGQAFLQGDHRPRRRHRDGSVEWMRASSGVWHTGELFGEVAIKVSSSGSLCRPSSKLAEPQSQYLGASTSILPGPRELSQANTTV